MTATATTADAILKDLYDDPSELEKIVISKEPALGILPKSTNGGGRRRIHPMMYAPTAGVSPNFAAAQAAKAGAAYEAWEITYTDMFSLFSIDHKAAKLCMGDAKAFIDLIESEVDAAQRAYQKILGKAIFGNSGGKLAEVESGGGTSTLTLTNREDLVVFDVNMQVQPSTTDGLTGSVIADIETITGVNRQDRMITQAGTWDGTNYANGNSIFLRGGFGNWCAGISRWLPATAPTDTIFGVDRSVDSRFYGTIRTGDTSVDATLTEFIMSLAADVGLEGGEPDVLILNTLVASQVLKQLDGKIEYTRMQARSSSGDLIGDVGFDGFKMHTEVGPITVLSSRNCPRNRAYLLQTDCWLLESVGPLMDFLEYGDDDTRFLRHGNENAMEGRIGAYFNIVNKAPIYNGVGDITDYLDALP